MTGKLEGLGTEYKAHHYAIIDLTEGLQREQEAVAEHDDNIAQLGISVQRLIAACSKSPESKIDSCHV